MRLSRLLALSFVLLLPAAVRAAGDTAPADLVKARLVTEAKTVTPGERFWVGLHLEIKEHWHVYWRNPGDSGLPVKLEWELPRGFTASDIHWPAPGVFRQGPLANFGYADEVTLLVEVTPPPGLEPGSAVPLKAKASWLVCEEECLPGEAAVQGSVVVGDEEVLDDATRPLFTAARAALPQPAPWPVALERAGDKLALRVDEPSLGAATLHGARFFPFAEGVVENAAPQPLTKDSRGLRIELAPSAIASAPPTAVEGVLVVEEKLAGDAAAAPVRQAFTVKARVSDDAKPAVAAAAVSAAPPTVTAANSAAPGAGLGLLEVLLFAILGGLILNLMPCVFPVLSLKVLGVVQQSGADSARVKLHGVAYTAGILVSFAALAGLLLLFRAGGAEIGWGFQLQSPVFVTALAYVMLAMALSLSGVLEVGNSVMGVGSRLAAKQGYSGSFFTGVVATVVATPCTAPFMGAAVGFALLQPAVVAIGIFLALGFGLALPFLALSFAPSLTRRLPRPGAWMVTLKEALAFPLYGTVAWLVWVLHAQVGAEGLAAVLAGLVLVGLAAWAYGRSRLAGGRMRLVGNVVTAVAALGAVGLLRLPAMTAAAPSAPVTASAAAAAGGYEAYSPARLDQLLDDDKPVFVNMTAAWCVTCLVNERTALSTDAVKRALVDKGITYLKGDWTNEDPEITRLLERFGRSGVPLYLYYPAGDDEPVVLPQILTESIVLEHLEKT